MLVFISDVLIKKTRVIYGEKSPTDPAAFTNLYIYFFEAPDKWSSERFELALREKRVKKKTLSGDATEGQA